MKQRKITKFYQILILVLVDVVSAVLAMALAYMGTVGFDFNKYVLVLGLINVITMLIVFTLLGLYQIIFTHVSASTALKTVIGSFILAIVNTTVVIFTRSKFINEWTVLMFTMFFVFFSVFTRFSYRFYLIFK
ncbi:MAG: hypothetical protein J6R88_06275, partial [Clostridia bacterium]|nr:hypothetical protein [Clostridia bacterium]